MTVRRGVRRTGRAFGAPAASGRIAAAVLASLALALPAAAAPTTDLPTAETASGNFLAATHADRDKDLGTAALYYSRALLADPENAALLTRTFALTLADGEMKPAMSLARRLIDVDGGNSLAHLAVAVEQVKRGSWWRAIVSAEKARTDPIFDLASSVVAAWADYGAGNVDKALQRLDDLEGPQWFQLFRSYHAGLIAEAAGRKAEAIDNLAKAREYDPSSVKITEAYVGALQRAGRNADAEAVIGKLAELGASPAALQRFRDQLAAKNRSRPAISDARVGAAEILSGLGNALARDDDGTEIVSGLLQLALHLDPKADVARVTLADIFSRNGAHERAIVLLADVDPASSLKRAAEIQIGFDYNALDKVDEARKHLEAAIAADPSDIQAIMALGEILRSRKMFEPAADVFSKAVAALPGDAPENWRIYYNRGIAYERTKQWPKAEADFKKALELSPGQPLVLNYLGYSWVDRGENFDEALAMIERAVAAEPTDGYIVDSLGWVFYKLGRFEEAVAQLERAVELRPADSTINDHLGDAYWRVGRYTEARFQWTHARDLGPEPEELPKILEKLKSGLPPLSQEQASDAGKPSGG